MVKKIENRNIDVTKARGELEEDLLEYVYRTWRQDRQTKPLTGSLPVILFGGKKFEGISCSMHGQR